MRPVSGDDPARIDAALRAPDSSDTRGYEGKSAKDAARAFGDTFGVLQSLYGAIETSQMASLTPGKPMDAEGLVAASATQVDLHGKAQMAPVKQPPGAFVFSTFRKDIVQGDVYFYVYVMYDPPQR